MKENLKDFWFILNLCEVFIYSAFYECFLSSTNWLSGLWWTYSKRSLVRKEWSNDRCIEWWYMYTMIDVLNDYTCIRKCKRYMYTMMDVLNNDTSTCIEWWYISNDGCIEWWYPVHVYESTEP